MARQRPSSTIKRSTSSHEQHSGAISHMIELAPFDARAFRQACGCFVTGVMVVATESEGERFGMTVNSFTSVSIDPPLVLFCAGKSTRTGRRVQTLSGFSVNVLRHDQEPVSAYFAGTWSEPEPPAFDFVDWIGGPRLEPCVAALGCRIESILEGGDHWIVIGRVLAVHRVEPLSRPLVFFSGRYATVRATSLGDEARST